MDDEEERWSRYFFPFHLLLARITILTISCWDFVSGRRELSSVASLTKLNKNPASRRKKRERLHKSIYLYLINDLGILH